MDVAFGIGVLCDERGALDVGREREWWLSSLGYVFGGGYERSERGRRG
jgi:hypothetical protein